MSLQPQLLALRVGSIWDMWSMGLGTATTCGHRLVKGQSAQCQICAPTLTPSRAHPPSGEGRRRDPTLPVSPASYLKKL